MKNYIILQTTVSERKDAKKIAKTLLDKKLIACAQIDGPIESLYRWKGSIEMEKEYRLSAKTTADAAEKTMETIRKIHPYETPEIIGSNLNYIDSEYAEWLNGEVEDGGE